MKIMGEKLCRQLCLEDLETIGLAEDWADEDLASFEQGAQRSEAETISKREKKLSVGTSSV